MRRILLLNCVLMIAILGACSSEREVSERRSLMMPKKSEMPRNAQKFKEIEYSNRSKYKKKQTKKIKRYNRRKSTF